MSARTATCPACGSEFRTNQPDPRLCIKCTNVRKNGKHETFTEYLMAKYPKEMAEFAAAAWQFEVLSPRDLDAPPIILVRLHIGKECLEKTITLEVKLAD